MKICHRKNRKTKHIIELHTEREIIGHRHWIDWYWCKCVWHNQTERFRHSRKADALQAMAHPDEWCSKCSLFCTHIAEPDRTPSNTAGTPPARPPAHTRSVEPANISQGAAHTSTA